MDKIRIFDSAFTPFAKSASLSQENCQIPTHFEWATEDSPDCIPGLNIYTDGHIKNVDRDGAIAWLLEPRHLRPENYEAAEELQDKFDLIVTYDKQLIDKVAHVVFCPFGGATIAFKKWGLYQKTKKFV